jgi:hypothetical protein
MDYACTDLELAEVEDVWWAGFDALLKADEASLHVAARRGLGLRDRLSPPCRAALDRLHPAPLIPSQIIGPPPAIY